MAFLVPAASFATRGCEVPKKSDGFDWAQGSPLSFAIFLPFPPSRLPSPSLLPLPSAAIIEQTKKKIKPVAATGAFVIPAHYTRILNTPPTPTIEMASMTMSSVAARAVSARATFRGSSKVSAVAPKAVAKRNVVVRAEGEVSVCVFFSYLISQSKPAKKNLCGIHSSGVRWGGRVDAMGCFFEQDDGLYPMMDVSDASFASGGAGSGRSARPPSLVYWEAGG